MEKLGMQRAAADDFDHPRIPEGHPLRRHVLYRLSRADWSNQRRPETCPAVAGSSVVGQRSEP
jgi:hypothetical protein